MSYIPQDIWAKKEVEPVSKEWQLIVHQPNYLRTVVQPIQNNY